MKFPLRALATPEAAVLFIALVLRVWMLDVKPPHFDEGINGWFADQMTKTGFYSYDPTNYHGPLHFYAVFVSQALFGRNLWALRLPAVIASLLCVWMMLRWREWLGRPIALIAAFAMACSPAYVFYGRYSIHESWQVLFVLITLWGFVGIWKTGSRGCLFTLVGGIAGMILTKETYVIHLGCLLLAAPCLWIWERLSRSDPADAAASQRWTWTDCGVAIAFGAGIITFFYSGTFLHWDGLRGLYQTFEAWFATGLKAGGHEKTAYAIGPVNYYWLALMARYEWPAAAGFILCFRYLLPSSRLLRYVAIYGCGTLVAYSIIPYKTPWCIVSILWPFYLPLADSLASVRPRAWAVVPSALVFAQSMFASLRLNFWRFTDPKEPYVYVQTYSEISTLTRPLLDLARSDPRGYHRNGQFLLDSYYPLPWILGDFTNIGYFKTGSWPDVLDGDFIVVQQSRAGEVEAELTEDYYRRYFRIRDAQEDCVAFFKASIFREILGSEPEIKRGPSP